MIKKAFGVSCLEINFLQAELEEVQEFYFQDSETGAGKPEQESVIKSTTIARNPDSGRRLDPHFSGLSHDIKFCWCFCSGTCPPA
ncbi:uncharacterized protein LOC119256736 isoform X3 [Talpa occidentalis]|uniref:uncharacterized protein LOC119256736 isoform X3 n=1 Tax=Talpa occidentalis TaxID=50954 RepID=UPI0023F83715|nr:uncharacterized protein LOC119256736 isoform X3 [Talpa occidentalis]